MIKGNQGWIIDKYRFVSTLYRIMTNCGSIINKSKFNDYRTLFNINL